MSCHRSAQDCNHEETSLYNLSHRQNLECELGVRTMQEMHDKSVNEATLPPLASPAPVHQV